MSWSATESVTEFAPEESDVGLEGAVRQEDADKVLSEDAREEPDVVLEDAQGVTEDAEVESSFIGLKCIPGIYSGGVTTGAVPAFLSLEL